MQKILENALEIGRKYIPEGECASYIPELAKADKNHLGVCIRTRGMETFSAGDTVYDPEYLQSDYPDGGAPALWVR